MSELSPRLRDLVSQSVALLGEVIRLELGEPSYKRIEALRAKMAALRFKSQDESYAILRNELKNLKRLKPADRLNMARAYTLMLEIMNTCENAYRSQQIHLRHMPGASQDVKPNALPDSVIYVLTAHPTEARSPANIWIFHEILRQLSEVMSRDDVRFNENERRNLLHSFQVAWRIKIVRKKKPRVQDEAEHVYTTLLNEETLSGLLPISQSLAPIYFRSWVGGDKDGHPGVDAREFLDSIQLSRRHLVQFVKRRLARVRESLVVIECDQVLGKVKLAEQSLKELNKISPRDGARVVRFKSHVKSVLEAYLKEIDALHPALADLRELLRIFPALVVPLEFRESSDVLMSSPSGKGLAIYRMLQALARVSRGGDPRWYVRGFIISMASSIDHMRVAAGMLERSLGDLSIPVIPLFEQSQAMKDSSVIVREMLKDPVLSRALKQKWNSQLEVMLGYSDSSKESGVLRSRLQIAETMHRLDRLCVSKQVTPIFFQGSGGSTDRGGGSIPEQTSWWSSSALRNYKVTVQGEMVERSLANRDIARGQIERINQAAGQWRAARGRKLTVSPVLEEFANKVAQTYEATVQSEEFLQVVEHATPYPFLNVLKFGSRPSKRTKKVSVAGLRAIPWIMCWTQTRILFPTWWGVGHAWNETTKEDRAKLSSLGKKHPLFSTYVRALGYTLAKVEISVWRMYVETSALSSEQKAATMAAFEREYQLALKFVHAVTGSRKLIAWRPWLQESIQLRSPYIHPLNLLQILAMDVHDVDLLRVTVAGISTGMMTTG